MIRPAILAALLTIPVLAGCKQAHTDDESEEDSAPAIVFTQERSTSEDVIYLRSEEELRGEVMLASLRVSTPYGELSIPVDRCARVAFLESDEDTNVGDQAIIAVNGDRVTGISTEPTIRFRDSASGEETEIEKNDVWFIAFQEGSDERDVIDTDSATDRFIMINGDLLKGHAAEDGLVIETDSDDVAVPFAEIETVRMTSARGEDADVTEKITAVVTRRNGDVVRGSLATEEMTLHLDLGMTIEGIARDRFARIHPGGSEAVTNSVGMEMVLIPSGTFTMGSPADEKLRDEDETQRRVTLTRDFYMGATEVTQAEWVAVMGENASEFPGGLRPVENVSWEEAIAFCNGLSTMEGLPVAYEVKDVEGEKKISLLDAGGQPTTDMTQVEGYRLPTGAEWEYACRAGTTTTFNTGDTINTDQANYDGDKTYGGGSKGVDLKQTVRVGSYPPNAWGLYDMHGNVWEWCHDLYGTYSSEPVTDPTGAAPGDSRVPRTARVLRGGGWSGGPEFCRSAYRAWSSPATREGFLGFRVVRSAD
ncbi:MAG: formylglycine-generating enzyme family protein [Planctomycetota bacterium]|nr:formylglycine-generating enzyme family protein [Planctomycetota bacterium]